jgi:hypothetical protein
LLRISSTRSSRNIIRCGQFYEAGRSELHVRTTRSLSSREASSIPCSLCALSSGRGRASRLEDVPLGRQCYADDVREEIRRRHAAGETLPEVALKTGIPYGKVKRMQRSGSSRRPESEVGTGVGTARAFAARLTHLTHATMRFSRVQAGRGGAYGIRTRATAVRGRRPRPLDECARRATG